MKKKVLAVIATVAIVGSGVYLARHRETTTGDVVRVSGNIEVTQTDVSFRIPGRVVQRPVDEGQVLTPGQLVACLDATDLERQVAVRRAELDAARAALAELQAGSRQEDIRQARAALEAATADAARLAADDTRQADLFQKDVISQREYDAAHTAMATSSARVKEALEKYRLLENGPRPETVAQARARVEAAAEQLRLAQSQLGYATLTAPVGGVVLSKDIEPGEMVAPGTPVISLGDLTSVWMRAYIDETELGRVKVGQRAWITGDSFPGKRYPGTVTFISPVAEFTPKSVQTERERVKLVYRITIDAPNPSMELKPGMPADATIAVGR